ncbi:Uncharacterised protein [Enterobacter cancerogenus]|uniref:Uncharacterized protein n=1 Tax=Enterobacter cancerogenus TaxID=69218 RepID=A0A484Y2A9_9ENTR|nr:Uncharacterised protein [Enterobacter cancerogenus]
MVVNDHHLDFAGFEIVLQRGTRTFVGEERRRLCHVANLDRSRGVVLGVIGRQQNVSAWAIIVFTTLASLTSNSIIAPSCSIAPTLVTR